MSNKKIPWYKIIFLWVIKKQVYPLLFSLISLICSIISLVYTCLLWGIISILSTYFGLFLWYVFRLQEKEEKLIENSNQETRRIANDVDGYFKDTSTLVNDYFKNINDSIHNYFKGATIIYKTNISSYDQIHINLLQQMIKQLKIVSNHNPHIYAIDYSTPLEWWNESMTAYLAICSKWQNKINAQSPISNISYRLLSRIFIYDELDLSNPLTIRTIFLHTQLGFNTYVFSYKSFIKLFNDYVKINSFKNLKPKELLLFENSNPSIKIKLVDGTSYESVLGYQSYWKIDGRREDMNEIKRKLELSKDNNNGKVKVNNIQGNPVDTDLLFEILDYQSLKNTVHEKTPDNYLNFIKLILLHPNNLIEVSQTGNIDDIYRRAKTDKYFGLYFNMEEPKNDVIESLLKKYLEIQY